MTEKDLQKQIENLIEYFQLNSLTATRAAFIMASTLLAIYKMNGTPAHEVHAALISMSESYKNKE